MPLESILVILIFREDIMRINKLLVISASAMMIVVLPHIGQAAQKTPSLPPIPSLPMPKPQCAQPEQCSANYEGLYSTNQNGCTVLLRCGPLK